MKYCKTEYDDGVYEIIREAAYRARLPIKQWVQRVAAEQAVLATGLPLPCTRAPQPADDTAPAHERNGTQTDAEENL